MRSRAWMGLMALTGCLSTGPGPSGPVGLEGREPASRPTPIAPDLVRRPPTMLVDAPPMVPFPRSHPRVGTPMGHGSLSIGTPTTGFVVSCRAIPAEGPHHYVLPEHRRRGTQCATDDLVEALLEAADRVAQEHPGARLAVGNLGREGGGDLPWSVSHNSGRDADLGFFLQDSEGRPYEARSLIALNGRGEGQEDGRPVRFDAARTWSLIKALLTDPDIQVQWIFLSNPLRRKILAHARSRKENPALLARAEEAMAQPRRSRPHDDHIHLRISCPADDVLEGCRDMGTQRTWFRDPRPRIEARVRQLQYLVRQGSPSVRADALTVLGRIGTEEALATVVRGLRDREVEVRRAASKALHENGIPRNADREVARRLLDEPDDEVAWVLLRALERQLNPWRRAAILPDLLASDRPIVRDLGVFRLNTTIRSEALEMASRLPLALVPEGVWKFFESSDLPREQLQSLWRGLGIDTQQDLLSRWDSLLRDLAGNRDRRPLLLRGLRSSRFHPTNPAGRPVVQPWSDHETDPSDTTASD